MSCDFLEFLLSQFIAVIFAPSRVCPPVLALCCKYRIRVNLLHAHLESVSGLAFSDHVAVGLSRSEGEVGCMLPGRQDRLMT